MSIPEMDQDWFSVATEQRGHAAHLSMFGEIDLATIPRMESSLLAAESNGYTAIVVDLGEVTFIDAGGLRALLAASRRAHQSGRTFEITNAQEAVLRVLRITGTTHLLASDAGEPATDASADPSGLQSDTA